MTQPDDPRESFQLPSARPSDWPNEYLCRPWLQAAPPSLVPALCVGQKTFAWSRSSQNLAICLLAAKSHPIPCRLESTLDRLNQDWRLSRDFSPSSVGLSSLLLFPSQQHLPQPSRPVGCLTRHAASPSPNKPTYIPTANDLAIRFRCL